MDNRNFNLVDEIYFCDKDIIYKGYIEKFNENTINVFVDDETQNEGYRVWRVEEFFLGKNPEEAKLRWQDYRYRLNEFKKLLNLKRKQNSFFKGLSVRVEPFDKQSYKGMVLTIGKAALVVVTEDGKFMKVDKSICTPIAELINFNNGGI